MIAAVHRSSALLLAVALLASAGVACSIRKFAVNRLGDALAGSGATYASDDDPQLVEDALPFALKLIESLLAETPRHRGLLVSAAGGFTQYAYGFLRQDADEAEEHDLKAADALRARASRLCLRARRYALRGIETAHPGFEDRLRADQAAALGEMEASDVPPLYWTAASWGAAISLAKSDPDLVADLSVVGALIERAHSLRPDYDRGTIEELLISYEGGRSDAMGGSVGRARRHFERAVALSEGQRASPFITFAETVSVREQDRKEFESILGRALEVDPDARPEWRLENILMQRRARWLLARTDILFLE